MDYNIVCIDPSLTCTAVVVNDKKAVFVKEDLAVTKKGAVTKWFSVAEPYCEQYFHTLSDGLKLTYTEGETSKLCIYDAITENIMRFVYKNIDIDLPVKIFIEGYSYSSAAGPLIDLVTFGGMLRLKLFTKLSNDLTIIAPTELKLMSAKLTYKSSFKGKKEEWRNNEGVAGGAFKKPDMYKALIENDSLQDDYINMLRTYASDIIGKASIPKPIEDLNDAKIMYEVAKADK